jgi:hypothetical protein
VSEQENQNNGEAAGLPTDVPESIPAEAVVNEVPVHFGEQTRDVFVEAKPGQKLIGKLRLANETYNETVDKLNNMPNEDYAKSASGREFLESFRESMFTIPFNSMYAGVTTRLGSYWVQELPTEAGKLGPSVQRWKSGDGALLTGEAAVMKMRQALGLGTTFSVPLYHTGIWVTVKRPSDDELIELERRLTEEKANLGRQTHGMIFGNSSAIFAGVLADFAIEHIYDSNLIEQERSYHQVIKCLDLPVLLAAVAYTIWPQGFPYSRVKLNPDDGTYITEEAIMKIGGTFIVDNLAITDRQRAHMAKQRGQKVNLETLKIYQEQFLRGQDRKIAVNDLVSLNVAVPSIADYLESGALWVNTITSIVDKALGLNADERKRVNYIEKLGKATNVRQFGHWVTSVSVDGNLIEKREDINNALDVYSGSDEYNGKFFDDVQQYIEDSTIQVIAVPRGTYEEESTKMKQFPNWLVLDVMSTFFILLLQKVQSLEQRM